MKFIDKLNKLNDEMGVDAVKAEYGPELDAQVEKLMGIVAKQKQMVDAKSTRVTGLSRYTGRAAAKKYRFNRYASRPLRATNQKKTMSDLLKEMKRGDMDVITLTGVRMTKKMRGGKTIKGIKLLKGGGPKGMGGII